MSWWQQVPKFRDRYSCITFSHPGFGSSTWRSDAGKTTDQSDVLSELLDRLEIDSVALIGQSMGGWSCLPVALQQPGRVRALFMASTPGNLRSPEIDDIRKTNQKRLEVLRTAWNERQPGSYNPAVGERCALEQPSLHYLYSNIQKLNPPSNFTPRINITRDEMVNYKTPTMFVTGDDDVVLPPEMIEVAAGMTPGAKLVRVANSGHSIYFERAEVFNSLLSDFLSEVYPV